MFRIINDHGRPHSSMDGGDRLHLPPLNQRPQALAFRYIYLMRTVMKAMKYVISGICLLALMNGSAQNGTVDPVLMRVDEQPVTRGEFEAIYKKNNKDASVTKEALDEYLELFINYKLKVREAEVLGMDTVAKFKQELAGYRDQLARPYLIDRELNEELIREAYDRSMLEVRAAHILVQLAPDASPEDTAAAWKRISTLRARVIGGEDFAVVARSKGGSDDPSAQQNGGDLGWFSAMQMVYPFENAAYRTDGRGGQRTGTYPLRIPHHQGVRQARGTWADEGRAYHAPQLPIRTARTRSLRDRRRPTRSMMQIMAGTDDLRGRRAEIQ